MKYAYIERVMGKRRITHCWRPIKDSFIHEIKKGKNRGKFAVTMANGKGAIATSIQDISAGSR